MDSAVIRLLVVDDHPVVRDGLGALMSTVEGIEVVAVPVTTAFLLGHDAPDPLGVLFVPGLAPWTAGLVPPAIACFRHGPVPRPVAAVLPATLPLTMALGAAGPLVEALTWAVLGVWIARAARRRVR